MKRESVALILSLFWGLCDLILEIKNFDQILPASIFGIVAVFAASGK